MPEPRPPIPYTGIEAFEIQQRLDTKLDSSHLSYRPAAQGTVAYLEGWKAFNLANEVFGFNGWSSEIISFTTDFTEVDASGRISLGMSCMVRVHLRDGTFHEDIGYGSAENQKSRVVAYEKAKKEAVTDAMKRALRIFGNRLGNCAYDKLFLKEVKGRPSGSGSLQCAANYPSATNQFATTPVVSNLSTTRTFSASATIAATASVAAAASTNLPLNSVSIAQSLYDDSIFEDNSMMISEEDFICEESFPANVQEGEFEKENVATNMSSHYPLVPPRKR